MLIYDIECYPNYWCLCAESTSSGKFYYFEISQRVNHLPQLSEFIKALAERQIYMVGFFNLTYDYPVLHRVLKGEDPYQAGQAVFNAERFQKRVKDPYVKQIDLACIMGYDTFVKASSLKKLEFVMRFENVRDLPYDPHTPLTFEQMDEVKDYCMAGDIPATTKFYHEVKEHVDFRLEMNDPYILNANDVKLGESVVINAIGRQHCYRNGGPVQTPRESISLEDCILPTIRFNNIELEKVRHYVQNKTICGTKGVFEGLNAVVKGFKLNFGLGGIHGSKSKEKFVANDKWKIIDVDVTSYYPSVAIVNGFEPEHLKGLFGPVYAGMKAERLLHAKGTDRNKSLKLGLNGSFGKTNEQYSPLYDPKCTMQITINGQFLLCQLFERLLAVNQVEPIQANTDGVTFYVRETKEKRFMEICHQWETETKLSLERTDYSRMWIRDVNNYIAEYTSGKLKLKGCYEVDKPHHKSHDSLIVAKAVRDFLVHGKHYVDTILNSDNPFDFCNFVNSNYKVWLGDKEIQRRSRYYVSTQGRKMVKELKNGRKNKVIKERLIKECNHINTFDWSDVDYDHYIKEVEKLII